MSKNLVRGIEDCIIELFDKLSYQYSYGDEGSVKNYPFFIVLKSFKTLIYWRFANKKSIDLPNEV